MTAEELANALDHREITCKITKEEERQAAENGLVIVFGYSDDNAEFCGAIDDEVGCFGGGTIYLAKDGILPEPECVEGDHCPYFSTVKKAAKRIEAVWSETPDTPCWTYETDIPHETFRIFEDGEVWCVGIVFSIKDLAPTIPQPSNEPLTLEELRGMDGEPVWVVYDQDAAKTTPGFDPLTLWALVEVTKDSVFLTNNLGGRTAYADDQDLEWAGITVYRCPLEGEEVIE